MIDTERRGVGRSGRAAGGHSALGGVVQEGRGSVGVLVLEFTGDSPFAMGDGALLRSEIHQGFLHLRRQHDHRQDVD
jgi:hypothetical protein